MAGEAELAVGGVSAACFLVGLPPKEDSLWGDAWDVDPEAKTAVEVDPGGSFGGGHLLVAQTRGPVHPMIAAPV